MKLVCTCLYVSFCSHMPMSVRLLVAMCATNALQPEVQYLTATVATRNGAC